MARKVIHEGHNIKIFRKLLGKTQEDLAFDLDMTQQAVSLLEEKEVIDSKLMEDVARILKVPAEAIKNFDEDATVSYIVNTVNGNLGDHNTYNSQDKVVELLERMLKEKNEEIERLRKK